MSSVVISGDTSGAITLAAPAVSGTNTATLPAATGTVMVSGNMPAFSAYASANQSVSDATWTKCTFDVEDFDTNSNFASSRFTPTVAGYYQINLQIFISNISGTAPTSCRVALYKNGSQYRINFTTFIGQTANTGIVLNTIVYMNGTTDYLEGYGYGGNGTTTLVFASAAGGTTSTFFNSSLVRAA